MGWKEVGCTTHSLGVKMKHWSCCSYICAPMELFDWHLVQLSVQHFHKDEDLPMYPHCLREHTNTYSPACMPVSARIQVDWKPEGMSIPLIEQRQWGFSNSGEPCARSYRVTGARRCPVARSKGLQQISKLVSSQNMSSFFKTHHGQMARQFVLLLHSRTSVWELWTRLKNLPVWTLGTWGRILSDCPSADVDIVSVVGSTKSCSLGQIFIDECQASDWSIRVWRFKVSHP